MNETAKHTIGLYARANFAAANRTDEIDAALALAAPSNISKKDWFQLIGNRYTLRKDGPMDLKSVELP